MSSLWSKAEWHSVILQIVCLQRTFELCDARSVAQKFAIIASCVSPTCGVHAREKLRTFSTPASSPQLMSRSRDLLSIRPWSL